MHTLFDVESDGRRTDDVRPAPGWPPGYPSKARLIVPQTGRLILPKALEGLGAWSTWETPVGEHLPELAPTQAVGGAEGVPVVARSALLTAPSFIAQLPRPDVAWLSARSIDHSKWRRELPRHLLTAVRFDSGGRVRYGAARTLYVENGLAFGSTAIGHHEEVWLDDFDSFADHLAMQVVDAVDMQPMPEGNAKPWTTAMLLLNDQSREPALPTGWQHAFRLVAGLYRVRLAIHASAWANRKRILHDIRTAPPEALLVADGSVPAPQEFICQYQVARPHGYAETLGSDGSSYQDQILELGMHLKLLAPLATPVTAPPASWADAKIVIEALECDSFRLTARARESLADNPYPDPARMTWHLERLAEFAAEYADAGGVLGQRMADEGRRFGIEIALHDSGLSPNAIESGGETYLAEPHVKVDDAKTPDKCGRIYFAVDSALGVLIVDHVGLHDYG